MGAATEVAKAKKGQLGEMDIKVVELLRSNRGLSYTDVDRMLGKYPGFSGYHARRYCEITGEYLFGADDEREISRGRTREEYTSSREMSEIDEQVAEMKRQGMSNSEIDKQFDAYYGFASYHLQRYRNVTGRDPIAEQYTHKITLDRLGLTEEGLDQLRELLVSGERMAVITEKTGLRRHMIYSYMRKAGLAEERAEQVKKLEAQRRQERHEEGLRLWNEGHSLTTVAKRVGVQLDEMREILGEEVLGQRPNVGRRLSLTPEQGKILVLCRAAGDTVADAGRVFNISTSAVSRQMIGQDVETYNAMTGAAAQLRKGVDPEEVADRLGLSGLDRELFLERVADRNLRGDEAAKASITGAQRLEIWRKLDEGRTTRELVDEMKMPLYKIEYIARGQRW